MFLLSLLSRALDAPSASPSVSTSPISSARISEIALKVSLWAGVAIALVFLITRIWIRLKVFRRLQPDDPLVIAAWVLSVANAVIWTIISKDLYLILDITSGKIAQIPMDFLIRLERMNRGNLAAYLISYASLWSIKISFIVFFRRFGEKLRNQRIAWYAVLGFCLASFLVCLGTVDYRCLTRSGTAILVVCMDPRTKSFQFVTLRLTTALDILTDFSIILLSTNVLWRIRLSLWTKLALGGIFSMTMFVIAVAIVRIVLAPSRKQLDLSWLVFWQGIELSVALVVVSLASFRILYTSSQQMHQQAVLYQNDSNPFESSKSSGSKGASSEIAAIDLDFEAETHIFTVNTFYVLKELRNVIDKDAHSNRKSLDNFLPSRSSIGPSTRKFGY